MVGEGITSVKLQVSCGSKITLDLKSSVYWLDWMGAVHTCDYHGSNCKELYLDLANAIAFHNGNLLLFPIEKTGTFLANGERFSNSGFIIKVTSFLWQFIVSSEIHMFTCNGLFTTAGCSDNSEVVPATLSPEQL